MAETGWPLIPREVLPAPVPPAARGRRIPRTAQPDAGRQLSIFGAETTEPSPLDLAGLLTGPGRLDRMGGTARVAVTVDAGWRVHVLVAELVGRGLVVHWRPLQNHDEIRRVPSPQESGAHPHTGDVGVHPTATPAPQAPPARSHRPARTHESPRAGRHGRAADTRPAGLDGTDPAGLDGADPADFDGADPAGFDGADPADFDGAEPVDFDGADVGEFDGDPALDDVGVIGAGPAPHVGPAAERGDGAADGDGPGPGPGDGDGGGDGDGPGGDDAGGDGTRSGEPTPARVLFEVRTAYSSHLNGLARAWPAAADQLFLSGPRLRLWVAAAGRPVDGGYALGLGDHDPPTWPAIDAALRRAGLQGTLSDHGLEYLISGRKRLARLAELVGSRPEAAPAELWPGGAAA